MQQGTLHPITLELTENGSAISGVVTFDGVLRGVMTGVKDSKGHLVLQGTARDSSGVFTFNITYWDSVVSQNRLEAFVNVDGKASGYAGTATITTKFVDVLHR